MTGIANPLVGNCMEWERYRLPDGYGQKWHNGKVVLAHRLAYCQHHGLELSDIEGQVVRHRCDSPSCVNPEHLELGTHADNVRDRQERGRSARGTAHGLAKLTAEQVLAIREEYVAGCRKHGGVALARKYGVSQQIISSVVNRKIWTHI